MIVTCKDGCSTINIKTSYTHSSHVLEQIAENSIFVMITTSLAVSLSTNPNERSIVMKVSVGQWSTLLPGDMEGTTATITAKRLGQTLQSTVYKIAHHGASTRVNSLNWLTSIKPRSAFPAVDTTMAIADTIAIKQLLALIAYRPLLMLQPITFTVGTVQGLVSIQNNFRRSSYIYETSPSQNRRCILMIVYYFSGCFNPNCFLHPLNHFTDEVYDDVCFFCIH